jgi:arsenite methyltransferase
MIERARNNAAKQGLHPPRVAFVQAALTEALPIASDSVDCVISNCVINLLPPSGKASLLKEVSRVLKPGGRVVFDDVSHNSTVWLGIHSICSLYQIVANAPLPENIRNDLAAYVGCISGAILVEEYRTLLTEAGLTGLHTPISQILRSDTW